MCVKTKILQLLCITTYVYYVDIVIFEKSSNTIPSRSKPSFVCFSIAIRSIYLFSSHTTEGLVVSFTQCKQHASRSHQMLVLL